VSKRITADMVEASEFQDMAMKYQVMGVPKTVINEKFTQEGAAPERMIMALIRKAADSQ
jgi:predicted DsbA family dithiol-disulfide isomerase